MATEILFFFLKSGLIEDQISDRDLWGKWGLSKRYKDKVTWVTTWVIFLAHLLVFMHRLTALCCTSKYGLGGRHHLFSALFPPRQQTANALREQPRKSSPCKPLVGSRGGGMGSSSAAEQPRRPWNGAVCLAESLCHHKSLSGSGTLLRGDAPSQA